MCISILVSIFAFDNTRLSIFSYGTNIQYGPGGSSGKALGYGLDGSGSIPGVGGVEIFLNTFVSRLVLGSTQPPIYTGEFPGGG